MKKSQLLRTLQTEIRRHDFSTFVESPPSLAQGGKGVVVPGCPACQKRINTMAQFLDHLADDALPVPLKRHVATIDVAELYSPYFSGTETAKEFYSRLNNMSSPETNDALAIFNQAARMVWLADRLDEVAADRPGLQALFYIITAEVVAKAACKFTEEGQSKAFVRKFFEQLCTDEARERLAHAFAESPMRIGLSRREAVDFLYRVRCGVAHQGRYYFLPLPREGEFEAVVPDGEDFLITNLKISELRQMVLEGAARTTQTLLTDPSAFVSTKEKAVYMGDKLIEARVGDIVVGPHYMSAIVIAVNGTYVKLLGIETNEVGDTVVLAHPSKRSRRWIQDCPAGDCRYLEKQALNQ